MRNYPQRSLPLLVVLAFAATGWSAPQAQAQSVSGTVTSGQTLATLQGANVQVKGTNLGTTTNSQGVFTLNVSSLQDTLVVSLLGFAPREIPIDGRTRIDIQLTIQAIETEELIVTGYRVQERGSVTGSVSSVNAEEFEDVPTDNLSNALAGRLSGVTVTQNAGTPGR